MTLFSEGFRIFFAAACGFALLALAWWLGWWGGYLPDLPTPLAPMHWHAHEMIFGYGGAVLAGFFMTAVPNWTGAKGAPARFLGAVFALWALGRGGMVLGGNWALLDLVFLPVLATKIAAQLIKAPKVPQLVFLLALALLWAADLAFQLHAIEMTEAGIAEGLRAGLLTLVAMILILGGRVTPGFTRNAMVAKGRQDRLPRNPAPLALITGGAALGLAPLVLAGAPEVFLAPVAALAGLGALVRVALWQGLWTRDKPILWTLHLSYGLAGLGLLAYAGAALGWLPELTALHLLGIGAVGGMTVSVLTRASLGHSGRPLIAPRPVVAAYVMIPLATLARCLAAETGADWPTWVAGTLWCLAFALILVTYWPIWSLPRLPRTPVGQPK